MQETWVWSLGWEDPLEKGMATHSSILAWRIPWAEEPGGLQCMESQRVGHDWATNTHTPTHTCPLPLWGSRTRRLHCLCCVPHPDPVCQGDVLGQAWTRANRSRWKTEGLLSAYTNCIFLKYPYLIFLTFWWMYKWDMKKIDLTFS